MPETNKPSFITDEIWNLMSEEAKNELLGNIKKPKKEKEKKEIEYYKHKASGECDDTVIFTDTNEFRQAIIKNPLVMDRVIKHMENISFAQNELIKSNNVRTVNNKEKEGVVGKNSINKAFANYSGFRCLGHTKNGNKHRCIYMIEDSKGFCNGCIKKGNDNGTDMKMDAHIIKTEFKEFKNEFKNKPDEILEWVNNEPKPNRFLEPKEEPKEEVVEEVKPKPKRAYKKKKNEEPVKK